MAVIHPGSGVGPSLLPAASQPVPGGVQGHSALPQGGPFPPPPVAESNLLEAARRIARAPAGQNAGRVALVLHLAALRPPAPRPHHRRIARAILQDAAQRHGGQVFVLRNGDLVLLSQEAALHDAGPRDLAGRDGRGRDGGGRDGGAQDPRRDLPVRAPLARRLAARALAASPGAAAGGGSSVAPAGPPMSAMVSAFWRLLRIDVDDPARLVSVWPLDRDYQLLLNYAAARVEERVADPPPAEEEAAAAPAVVDEISAVVGQARIHDLMQRQTAVVLLAPGAHDDPARGVAPRGAPVLGAPVLGAPVLGAAGLADEEAGGSGAGSALRPIYREVTFSIAALEARITAGGHASADPFLFRHLALQLDRRMLDLVREELGHGGPLDIGIGAHGAPPLHLNLTIGAILSPSFAAFAATCREAGATAGIEVSLIEASADSRSFAAARQAIMQAGMALVLDGVSHLTLLLAAPWTLEPDLLKLDWSPRLAELSPVDRDDVAAAIEAIGAHRVVLQRSETEAALRWGLANGIRRFQGRHVDAMLGASRIMGCKLSNGCTLRQCIERAAGVGPAARAGCGNTPLLDAGAPPRAAAMRIVASRSAGARGGGRATAPRAVPRLALERAPRERTAPHRPAGDGPSEPLVIAANATAGATPVASEADGLDIVRADRKLAAGAAGTPRPRAPAVS